MQGLSWHHSQEQRQPTHICTRCPCCFAPVPHTDLQSQPPPASHPTRLCQEYGPGRRAHSLLTWLASSAPHGGASIPEEYVLILEPDLLVFHPPPVQATPTRPASFD